MKFLGFYPDSVVARVRAAGVPPRMPTLEWSVRMGASGFCIIGVVVFIVVALADGWLRRHLGEAGSYAIYALLFILPAGGLFRQLAIKPAPLVRFYLLFAVAFLLYSTAWMTVWVALRTKSGEWLASLAATTALGLTLATAFDAPRQAFKAIAVLFVARSAGYFGGELLHSAAPGLAGWLLWGAAYGLGLGSGLGYALHACQEPAREKLKTIEPTAARWESNSTQSRRRYGNN
ncbi:MAG TPA: hypothetical protein VN887_06805 [Candidatus Angelobacter sp.]|nr:hypothetical protein [Candidatus Angelobacter sp.]